MISTASTEHRTQWAGRTSPYPTGSKFSATFLRRSAALDFALQVFSLPFPFFFSFIFFLFFFPFSRWFFLTDPCTHLTFTQM